MSLAAGILLAVGLLLYVFYLREEPWKAPPKTRLAYLRERKDVVYENLRDLNFEFKAGKLPQADYGSMRVALEEEAAVLLAEIEDLEAAEQARAPQAHAVSGERD
ncbi:MAG: hypothetical protein ACRD2R_00950 [Terriglobales bacterium]